MTHFGDPSFWEKNYADHPHEPFEWYHVTYDQMREEIQQRSSRHGAILYIGCGTSDVANNLLMDGYTRVVAVDQSESAIKWQQAHGEKAQAFVSGDYKPGCAPIVEYKRVNVAPECTDDNASAPSPLPWKDGHFDLVIDKATIDCCFAGADHTRCMAKVKRAVGEIYRVLKKGGCFLHVSHTDRISGQREGVFSSDEAPWASAEKTHLVINQSNKEVGANDSGGDTSCDDAPPPRSSSCWLFCLKK